MKLIKDARYLWTRLWSVRLALLSALLSAIETAMNYISTGQTPIFVVGAFLVSIGSVVARLIDQETLYDDYAEAP